MPRKKKHQEAVESIEYSIGNSVRVIDNQNYLYGMSGTIIGLESAGDYIYYKVKFDGRPQIYTLSRSSID